MILTLAAVGRFRDSEPEQALARDWIGRAAQLGRGMGIKPVRLVEVDPRTPQPDPAREAAVLLDSLDASAEVWLLDERGEQPGSAGFARLIGTARDQGASEIALLIGGADGHGPLARDRARRVLAFGPWTWPHRLVRAMAAEQVYRGLSILAGTPYHRA
jgi:23S rRNA (pseudouridine1915-N3)-methyltransferase